jgi:uncharacterized membrane protein
MSTNHVIQQKDSKLTLNHWLFISCCFSVLLICARVTATGYFTYLFLVWNLFLAFIPYAISEWFYQRIPVIENRWKRLIVLTGWLVFVPNSFYIVTDLFHLEQFDNAPKWFDLLLLFSFAWNGLLFGILSVRRIETIITAIYGERYSIFFLLVVMWLNAFGIYIGRYLRYNSWDVIGRPFSLLEEMLEVIFHPIRNSMEWGMITLWAAFMALFYITIKVMSPQTKH